MNVSTKEVFSIFVGWKDKKSALWITGIFAPLAGSIVSTGVPKFLARISHVDLSSESIFVKRDADGQELSIDLSGALFAIAPNNADSTGESFVVTARLREGGIAFFVEDFSRDTGHTPLPS